MLRIDTILHPIDFSEAGVQALDIAHALARDHRAKLVLATVVVPPAPGEAYLPEMPHVAEPGAAELIQRTRRQLTWVASTIHDVPVVIDVLVGSPGARIVEAARTWAADLIVMGTSGRTGLSRLLLGSVAEYVLRHAACPVLMVKPGRHEPTSSQRPSETSMQHPTLMKENDDEAG